LLLLSWLMLNASWDIGPCSVLLALGNIVSTSGTNNSTSSPYVGFRTVTRESWTSDSYRSRIVIRVIVVIIAFNLLALACWSAFHKYTAASKENSPQKYL